MKSCRTTVYRKIMRPLTLGIVPYYNMLPLIQGLDRFFSPDRWISGTPRDLAGMLATGKIDVAAVSIFESLRCAAEYAIVPGAAIGSDGPVRSVSLFSKVRPSEVTNILLDRASLSSANLMRVVAGEYLGVSPEYAVSDAPFTPDFDWHGAPQDAFLVIGDTALRWEKDFPYRLDLGSAWRELTGLPFVYAAWTVRAGLALSQSEASAFVVARIQGEAAVTEIVEQVPAASLVAHGGAEAMRRYLSENIRYGLGERELRAIDLFRVKLIAAGLLPAGSPPLRVAAPLEAVAG